MAGHSTPPALKEFCPLYYLLNSIPAKVQKGFRSVVVYLTALDTSSDYIAVGSSIGMLYLYCRRLSQMNKYNLEGKTEPITAVKLLSCFDDLVAVGTASGRVALFQLVSPLPGRNKQLRRFDVVGLHKATVTALAWSANGMKLFSGDDKGKVVYSAVDLDQGVCSPVLLLEEPSPIVQLEYSQKVLLVSSYQRSLLFYTQDNSMQQLGSKPRKSNGRFGACFHPGLCKQSDLLVYAARPGLRLWRADVRGSVQDTYLLKELFTRDVPLFELFPRPGSTGAYRPTERQLGLVSCFLKEGWVLTWNEYSVYVLDCLNQAIIGGLEGCGDIVSVSCTENEIFILKGDRDIIRISNRPEGLATNLSELSLRLTSPLSNPTTFLPPTGAVETAQPIRTMAIITEQEDKQAVGEEGEEIGEEVGEGGVIVLEKLEVGEGAGQRGSAGTSESRSRSSSVTSWDSALGLAAATEQSASEMSSSRYSTITQEDFQQELVVKAIKVKKKSKRRRQESGNRLSEHSSWSEGVFSQDGAGSDGTSTPACELPSDRTSLLGSSLDLHSNESPDQDGSISGDSHGNDPFTLLTSPDHPPAPPLERRSPAPDPAPGTPPEESPAPSHTALSLPGLEGQCCPGAEQSGDDALRTADSLEPELLTPDVDSLLQCTFAYMQAAAEQESCADEQGDCADQPEADAYEQEEVTPGSEQPVEHPELPHPSADLLPHGCPLEAELSASSDEEDIYAPGVPHSLSVASLDATHAPAAHGARNQDGATRDQAGLHKSDQLAESWMGYSGPGCGILSLAVTDRFIWCLDFKGGLFCSALPDGGLRWQRFEDNVQQVAVSPSGTLLWKVEQKTNKAFACGKVTIKGKRHWYEALTQAAFVALSDDTAWIIRTNGDLYLQTGLSVDRPCARSVKVDCPCPLAQISARGSVVWALSEQRGVFYREGLNSFCAEGEQWKYDKVSERQGLEPVCIALGEHQTAWALDTSGNLWFRTGVTATKPQGEDEHWWQVSITDYVVFDQCSLFQTLIQATQTVATATKAPVERVADRLRVAFWSQQPQCQPSLVSSNSSGVWIASGRNDFHVAKGSLVGTYWEQVVPRGTASATKWAFVFSSAAPTGEGSFLWLRQSRRDLFCVWDRDAQLRPSTVQLPPEVELTQLSACGDAVWGLDAHGRIHIRTLTASCPTGMHWTPLDLSQLGHVKLVSICCGSQNVWACDANGMVYFRVGTQPLNPSMMLPAWICIEPPEQPVGVHLVSVHTSPNDRMLWAVDSRGNVHVRCGITEEMPVGTEWEHIPGLQASQLVLSLRTVWVCCPNGEIARRYGITDKNPAGDYWKKIPGLVTWAAVSPLDELWAVSQSGALTRRLTKTFLHTVAKAKVSGGSATCDDLEDEWEVI
ncbi:tectonin beta-propeller repeat-containing protein 2 [Megalops cyprinoides]|uniref:tectonin beta-propeller repeat-containing protein 2 n=1 Tax=Megalops cyprinoides TaxID=118141 RepID=UPI001864F271|nr:tectonin beta-propeller repeat-containing protein 2 [Megalops cyprinoides]